MLVSSLAKNWHLLVEISLTLQKAIFIHNVLMIIEIETYTSSIFVICLIVSPSVYLITLGKFYHKYNLKSI